MDGSDREWFYFEIPPLPEGASGFQQLERQGLQEAIKARLEIENPSAGVPWVVKEAIKKYMRNWHPEVELPKTETPEM